MAARADMPHENGRGALNMRATDLLRISKEAHCHWLSFDV